MSDFTEAATLCRMARPSERDIFHKIWDDTFHDPAEFTDWLFRERFAPAFCPLVEVNGQIASLAHALPATMRVRDTLLPCVILGGVATLPEFRKRGMMHKMLGFLMREMYSRGIPLVVNRPHKLDTYFSLGHYPMCNMQYATRAAGYAGAANHFVRRADPQADCSAMYACYLEFSRRYSGIIHRSFADFTLKLRDYESGGCIMLVYEDASGVKGYAVCIDMPDGYIADECVASEDTVYQALFDALAFELPGKEFTMRLPPDVHMKPDVPSETVPRAVLGVADAKALLRATGLTGGAISITDEIVPQNNGVFTLDGKPAIEQPTVELSAGRLAQWIVGYRSIDELAKEGSAHILDADAAKRMDIIGKKTCYIIDEY